MHGTEDKETFLITLEQPKVFAQQMAFDKGKYWFIDISTLNSDDQCFIVFYSCTGLPELQECL